MKPNEAMRALPIEDEAAYGQSDKRMCQLINIRGTRFKRITPAPYIGRYHLFPGFPGEGAIPYSIFNIVNSDPDHHRLAGCPAEGIWPFPPVGQTCSTTARLPILHSPHHP